MSRTLIISSLLSVLVAACSGGGSSSTPTPNPTSYTIGAPAEATAGNSPAPAQLASPGGPTFTGAGAGLPPAGTVFPLTQTAYQFPASAGSADTQTMAAGATITVINLSQGLVQLQIPNLGINATVKDDSVTTTSLPNGENLVFGLNTSGELASLNYTALGNWVVIVPATGLATNMASYVTGYQTPVASMPTTGTASYGGNGTVVGSVLLPGGQTGAQLLGTSSLTANFGTGSLTGSFTNMTATPVTGGAATPWNNVSVTGSISGASFTGQTATSSTPSSTYALGAASGTIKGGFYGPAANEVGAVWTLYDGARAAFGGVAGPKTN